MSIVVLGMEMPTACVDCELYHVGFAYEDDRCEAHKVIFGEEDDWVYETRPNWCPLRPLPKKHGRLVDADELEDVFYRFHSQSAGYVQDAETIVEAEGD